MKKLLVPTLALILLCATIFCFGAAAEGDEAYANIPGHNLALEDSIHIIYYVDFWNVPAGAEKGVLIWTSPRSSYTYGTQNAKLTKSTGVYSSYLKYEYTDVVAKMMAQDIYAVAYIKDGNKITYSSLDKYSVLQYAYNKKSSSGLGALLTKMLNYGAEAQTYFGYKTDRMASSIYYQLIVENGTLPDGTTKGLYPVGTILTLTANAPGEGKAFSYWSDSTGQNLGTEPNLTILVSEGKTWSAVYGDDTPPEPTPNPYSEGLVYTSNGHGTCYVSGIGTCTDTDIVIPFLSPELENVTGIESNAFKGCTRLTSVTIPDSVKSIGRYAFSGCTSLTSVTIPDSVTSIADYAFSGCTGLTSVTIGNSVTSIADYAFSGCTGLTSVTIGNSVTSIGNYAFNRCTSLTSITIPDSVTSIGNYAFYGCTSLTSITIPDSVTSIGYSAFSFCTSLTSVTIGNSVTSIGSSAFSSCTSLTSITIPDSVTSIGSDAFRRCSGLESITIPFVGAKAGVTSSDTYQYPFGYIFGTSSYTGGTATKQSYYGSSTSSTTSTTYYIPSGLKSVTVTGGNILYGAFYRCTSLTSITIPDSVTSIGLYAFHYCTSLTSITIPDSVTSIGYAVFYDCTSLTSITIPDSVTSIGWGAFHGCTSLTSITIPDSVTSIGNYAFYNCSSLTSITIPDSVKSIGSYAFSGCSSLESITSTSPEYPAIGNCLIEAKTGTLIAGCKNSVIPTDGSVTSIGSRAFYYCTSLTSITIPDSVTSIGDDAFTNCTSLTSITFGEYSQLTSIRSSAFSCCSKLTSITIPDSVTSIGSSAFSRCTSLTSITIPDSVTSIGSYAFEYCSKLTSITYTGTKAQWNVISKETGWNSGTGSYVIHCTDGDIAK